MSWSSPTAEHGSPLPYREILCMCRRESNGTCCKQRAPKLYTSVPVVIGTFTFLDRNANPDVALTWKEAVYKPGTVNILPCQLRDLEQSWEYFRRSGLYKLSVVDATSFAIMKRERIWVSYAFDHHFAVVGFRLVG